MVPRPQTAGRGLTRETLLATAAELFAGKGYRATTLDDIASALGLKKASLYHYIKSKDDLLADIYQQIFDRIEAVVAPLVSADLPVDERLRRMVHAHMSVVTAELSSLSVVFSEESELPPALQRGIRHRKRAHEALFEKVIAEGQRQGVFRSGSVHLMVLAMLGMCNWTYKWYRSDAAEQHGVDEIAAEFALILESGIRPGDRQGGARPRFSNLDEAFEPADRTIRRMRAELEQLETELDEARGRLQDGLAGSRELRPVKGQVDSATQKRRGHKS